MPFPTQIFRDRLGFQNLYHGGLCQPTLSLSCWAKTKVSNTIIMKILPCTSSLLLVRVQCMILVKQRVFVIYFSKEWKILYSTPRALLFSKYKNSKSITPWVAGKCFLKSSFPLLSVSLLTSQKTFWLHSSTARNSSMPFTQVCAWLSKWREWFPVVSPDVCVQHYCY